MVERTTTKLKTESLQHSKLKQQSEEYENEFKRKSKELKTAHLQLDNARKEIRTLTYKIEVSNNEDVYNRLVSMNSELKKENEDLQQEIKALEKIQNEQGKQLLKVADETDFYNKIKGLGEELRME